MKLSVQVKTNSKKESVEELPDGTYLVRVSTPPIDGKANERIRELLAKHFGVPKSRVEIVHGLKGKSKIFEIN